MVFETAAKGIRVTVIHMIIISNLFAHQPFSLPTSASQISAASVSLGASVLCSPLEGAVGCHHHYPILPASERTIMLKIKTSPVSKVIQH